MIARRTHMVKTVQVIIVFGSLLISIPAHADSPAINEMHVTEGQSGQCYARSTPSKENFSSDDPDQAGLTEVFRRQEGGDDILVDRYDWYSYFLLVHCDIDQSGSIGLVRTGPWHIGWQPEHHHLQIAFYANGQELSRYSTLDIAKPTQPELLDNWRNYRIRRTVSHYRVVRSSPKFGVLPGRVHLETIDGRFISFDMATGERLPD